MDNDVEDDEKVRDEKEEKKYKEGRIGTTGEWKERGRISHFGEAIIEEVFSRYQQILVDQLFDGSEASPCCSKAILEILSAGSSAQTSVGGVKEILTGFSPRSKMEGTLFLSKNRPKLRMVGGCIDTELVERILRTMIRQRSPHIQDAQEMILPFRLPKNSNPDPPPFHNQSLIIA
ncbi:hypothetical protein VNO77_02023 [Canavalia gladiata]|uniref:Uncharacterized protein n=1 Tax=Canavalia gladiata TaxID=3824 RepID=A0AAN9R5Q6_CANGL